MSQMKKFVCPNCAKEAAIHVQACPNMLCEGKNHISVDPVRVRLYQALDGLTTEELARLEFFFQTEVRPEYFMDFREPGLKWLGYYMPIPDSKNPKNTLEAISVMDMTDGKSGFPENSK